MTPDTTSHSDPPGDLDPETLVDALFEYEVVEEVDGHVSTTEAFEHRRSINNDTYLDMEPAAFRDVVAKAFDLSEDEAADRIEAGDVSPERVAAFYALRGHIDELDRDMPDPTLLGAMADLVTEIEPASPVPHDLRELTSDDYEAFLDEHEDAVVIVFKRDCDPCETTKELLPEIQAIAPPRVAFAGIDAGDVPAFLREFEVEAAPTSLVFADGDLVESLRGHRPLSTYEETFTDAYD